MRTNIKTCSLDELEDECIKGLGTTFGHNMIGIICSEAEKRFGKEEAKRLFDLYQG